MAKINLLPWRAELREKRKKHFIILSSVIGLIAVLCVGGVWYYFDAKLQDQMQANQRIIDTNANLDTQLKSLDGLQDQRNQIIERMKLIQGLQSQRPVVVRFMDELPRMVPKNLYLTKFERTGNKFLLEGKAESPNTVAEFLRNLEASPWYRNAFMNSFLVQETTQPKASSSVVPRIEESYGTFVVTVDLEEPESMASNNPTTESPEQQGGGQ